jgi:uncharacterized membrane-anchored protein YhcB (DUF1043 family)
LRRLLDPTEQKLRTAEMQLEQTQTALSDYRLQVTEHFNDTAERVNRLTEDYRDLHQHLSDGALVLCDVSDSTQQPPLLTSLSDSGPADDQNLVRAQPLDYAPKQSKPGAASTVDDFDFDRIVDD